MYIVHAELEGWHVGCISFSMLDLGHVFPRPEVILGIRIRVFRACTEEAAGDKDSRPRSEWIWNCVCCFHLCFIMCIVRGQKE